MNRTQLGSSFLALTALIGTELVGCQGRRGGGGGNGTPQIVGEGWEEGQVSLDWTAVDQSGEDVHLYDFAGDVVLVAVAAEWAAVARSSAAEAEANYQARRDLGFEIIHILLDGMTTDEAPDPSRWAQDFGLTFTVVGDHEQTLTEHYIVPDTSGSFGIPNHSLLDREMRIVSRYQEGTMGDWSDIDALIELE